MAPSARASLWNPFRWSRHSLATDINVFQRLDDYYSYAARLTQDLQGIRHKYKWTFEIDPQVRKMQSYINKAERVFGDVAEADGSLASVDVVAAGFPCQPFSLFGKGEGIKDLKKRRLVIFNILDTVANLDPRPRLLLFENVYGLFSKHGELLKTIVSFMKGLGYTVRVWALNALHSGVCQNRIRVWIIGLRTDCMVREPRAPEPLDYLPPLRGFLDPTLSMPKPHLVKRMQKLVRKVQKIKKEKIDIAKYGAILDIGASDSYFDYSIDRCMCLTKSRAAQFDYYVLPRESYITCDEIAALMGVPKEYLEKLRHSNLASFRISFGLVFVHPSRNASPDHIVIVQTMYALCIHMSKPRPTHGLLAPWATARASTCSSACCPRC